MQYHQKETTMNRKYKDSRNLPIYKFTNLQIYEIRQASATLVNESIPINRLCVYQSKN
jgi:hypothetical protein